MDREISRRQAFGLLGAAGASTLLPSGVFANSPASETLVGSLQGAGFYKFKLGSFNCALVSDGGFTGEPRSLFPKVEPEDLESAARESFVSVKSLPMHINTMLIQTGKENILIDTGCGPNYGETAGKLEKNLQMFGLKPDSISHIIITHAHGDHYGGYETFKNTRFFAGKTEHDFWTGSADLSTSMLPEERRKQMAESARNFFTAVKDRLELIDGEKEVTAGISMIPAFGHTPGHCAIMISSGSEQLMYLSDAVHVPSLQMMHPEFQIMFDADPGQAEESRRRLLDRAVSDRVLVSGSHLPFPALGHIKTRGVGYEFVPEIWQW